EMNRDYPERPIVGVGAVIVRDGRVVLVRRGNEPRQGEWSIPGGVLEIGETGLEVEAGEVLEVFDSIHPDPAGRTRYHFVIIDFLCRVIGGELRPGGDVLDARWVTVGDLESFQLAEKAESVIRKALEHAR